MYFSVIVTVYRVEQYLGPCVESILAQTDRDFELILVDDGSPDSSPALCDAFAARDSRVRVLHQANAGVVSARAAGLRAAAGRYVLFVDGDDWVGPQYLQWSRALIEENGAALVLFAAFREHGDFSEIVCEPVPEGLYCRSRLAAEAYPTLLMDPGMRHMSYSPCARIFRKDLAERGFLTVDPQITLGEDLLSVLPALLEAESVYVSRRVPCFYRVRPQSASRGFRIEHYRQVELVLEQLEQQAWRESSLPADFGEQMDRYGAYMCFTLMIHAVNDGRRDCLGRIRAEMRRPRLRRCLRQARFQGITAKTRITLVLFRLNLVCTAYVFLRLCRWMKERRRRRNG